MPKLEISYTPENFVVYKNVDSIVVVVDVFRATTAMCTAFENGVEAIIPVESVEKAREYQDKGYLVGAERNGEKLDGFDFGNSPFDFMTDRIRGKTIVMTTTNGTRAINLAKNGHKLVIGSFLNLSALADWLGEQNKNVIILCAGWKGRINLEDTLYSGALTKKLIENGAFNLQSDVEDTGLLAMYSYQLAKDDPNKFLMNSSHRRRLKSLNLKEDIRYSLSMDLSNKIPILEGDRLIALEQKSAKRTSGKEKALSGN
ncbi:MAG TPA: 2-phosphosulfolactate phosphatase [Flavobacteriales bacterium]|jgi:2-phosphosulfolactate phosphatase|nr:2-phosphosulfolactate phosphatase [Flavobacteriales bacterium]